MDERNGHGGRFLASLVTQQTSLDREHTTQQAGIDDVSPWHSLSRRERDLASQTQPAQDAETSFRHRSWLPDRRRVIEGLARSGISLAGLERFLHCGAAASVEVNEAGTRHRLRANYCGHRFCKPCAAARARVVQDNLLKWVSAASVVFITLTLKASDDSLADVLDRLYSSFTKLRAQKDWKKRVSAGASFTEITRGASGKHWHVHLHVLAVCDWYDQKMLAEQWFKATGDSFIVDVRRVRDPVRQVRYVASYATKGFSRDVLLDQDALIECIVSLRGRRLLATFGRWGRLGMEDAANDAGSWRRVGSLVAIVAAAGRREQWAAGVLASLGVLAVFDAGKVTFIPARADPGGSA